MKIRFTIISVILCISIVGVNAYDIYPKANEQQKKGTEKHLKSQGFKVRQNKTKTAFEVKDSDGKIGLYGYDGSMLVPPCADDWDCLTATLIGGRRLIIVNQNGERTFVDSLGHIIIPKEYQLSYDPNGRTYRLNDKIIYLDNIYHNLNGTVYVEVQRHNNESARNLISLDGKRLSDTDYISFRKGGKYFYAFDGNNTHVIKPDGAEISMFEGPITEKSNIDTKSGEFIFLAKLTSYNSEASYCVVDSNFNIIVPWTREMKHAIEHFDRAGLEYFIVGDTYDTSKNSTGHTFSNDSWLRFFPIAIYDIYGNIRYEWPKYDRNTTHLNNFKNLLPNGYSIVSREETGKKYVDQLLDPALNEILSGSIYLENTHSKNEACFLKIFKNDPNHAFYYTIRGEAININDKNWKALAMAAMEPASGFSTLTTGAKTITKSLPALELIDGSIRFVDNSGYNAIEANGRYEIEFEVRNNGQGNAIDCQPLVKVRGTGLTVTPLQKIDIAAGQTLKIIAVVTSSDKTASGNAEFSISVDEPSGFGTDEQLLTVNTHAFEAPHLVVNDYTITGSGAASTLQKKQPFDLQLLVQNIEHGTADDVTIEIAVPENVFVVEGDMSMKLGRMGGGETKSLVYTLVANNRFEGNSIPVQIKMREKYGRYADNRTITLEIEQPLASSKISVSEGERKREDIKLASLTSEIDRNIPSGKTSPNTFAVIISNENYNDVPTVPHALNDGNIFREYCRKTLGIPESNIRYVGDATRNDITRHLRWLEEISNAYGNDADIIFYYSGHGVPSEKDHTSYLMPVDGYYADMSTNMSLNDIYSMLGSMNVRRVTVFLDACFSGADRNDGMLMSARGVKIKAKDSTPSGSMVVFSASQGDETAYPYNSERHGLFTYFLLKKLRETNGDVTLGDLGDYIINEVRKKSVVENSKPQTPAVLASPTIASVWRDLKL